MNAQEREALKNLQFAGAMLANCAFNLSQRVGDPMTQDVASTLSRLRVGWDVASTSLRQEFAALTMPALPLAAPGSDELIQIHAVIMNIGGDWPEVEGDPYTVAHVKRMARDLTGFIRAEVDAGRAAAQVTERDMLTYAEAAGFLPNSIRAWMPALTRYTNAIFDAGRALGTVPDGWRLVPVEYTESMMADAWRSAHRVITSDRCNHEMLAEAYRAMLATAPQPAAPHPAVGHQPKPSIHAGSEVIDVDLNTTHQLPAPVERKPLTDAQISNCAWGYFEDSKNLPDYVEPFVRAIEQAHGISQP